MKTTDLKKQNAVLKETIKWLLQRARRHYKAPECTPIVRLTIEQIDAEC